MTHQKKILTAVFLSLGLVSQPLFASIEITLKNDFIEQYKNKATISASFTVDKAHPRPNAAKADGDLHAAGRAPEVQLPIVAEVMNAKSEKAAVDAIHKSESTHEPVPLIGIWRIWCEHGGDSRQVQGEPLQPFKTTNPPHVFEIHPITTFDSTSIVEALHPIRGYKPKDAEAAFLKYESLKSHIVPGANATTLVTTMAGYNYVEFVAAPIADEHQESLSDGTGVYAAIYTLDGDLLVHKRRLVFVKGSPEETALKSLKPGEGMHLLGVPRISLKLLSFRVKNHSQNEEMLDWSLPYEIAVVAFYEDVPADELEGD